MPDQKIGFDPLSSLFEIPDPAIGSPLSEADPTEETTIGTAGVQVTDSYFRISQDRETPPDGLRTISEVTEKEPTEVTDTDVGEAPSDTQEMIDPVAIARAVGKAAAARAEPTPVVRNRRENTDREAAENGAIEQLMDKGASEPPASGISAVLNAEPVPDAAETQAPRYGVKRSRTEAIAARAKAPIGALEAARLAAEREAAERSKRNQANAKAAEQQLSDRIQNLVPRILPKAGPIYVANALRVEQRSVLRALWRSHRSRFMADGQLERAVGAAAVLHALDGVSEEGLVVAHVVTDASDYLLWMDLDRDTVLAAFADARAYFAGTP